MHVLADKIQVLKKELVTAKKTLEENEQTLEKLLSTQETVQTVLENLNTQLSESEAIDVYQSKQQLLKQQIEDYQEQIRESQHLAQYKQLQAQNEALLLKISNTQASTQYEQLIDKIASLKKVYEIEEFMQEYGIRRNYAMDRLLTALERIQPQMEQYKPIKDVRERVPLACVTFLSRKAMLSFVKNSWTSEIE